jgi:hypothetical protein
MFGQLALAAFGQNDLLMIESVGLRAVPKSRLSQIKTDCLTGVYGAIISGFVSSAGQGKNSVMWRI